MDRLVFTWAAVSGADAYLFTLSLRAENGRSRQIAHTGPIRENYYAVELHQLDQGTFEWQVEAVGLGAGGGITRHGQPAESSFTIELPPEGEIKVYGSGALYGF